MITAMPIMFKHQPLHQRQAVLTGQHGVSLVELLVGIAIGLMVILAATGTLVLNRNSSNTISDMAAVTAQGSNALRQMAYTLRQSGAMESTATPDTASLANEQQNFDLATFGSAPPGSSFTHPVTGATVGILNGRNNLSASGMVYDELTFVFGSRGANISRDCLGNQVAAVNADLPNRFFLQTDAPGAMSDINRPNLMCQGLAANPAQPVARNVEDLQIQYLVDQGATQQWRDAAQVQAAGAWNQVIAVELCLLIRGDINHGAVLTGTYTNCNGAVTAHDRFWRVVMRQTVQLRNRYNNL